MACAENEEKVMPPEGVPEEEGMDGHGEGNTAHTHLVLEAALECVSIATCTANWGRGNAVRDWHPVR